MMRIERLVCDWLTFTTAASGEADESIVRFGICSRGGVRHRDNIK